MEARFWHERWESWKSGSGELGFHQDEVNAQLVRSWPRLAIPGSAPVFVPLCGKSLDMHWLRAQGHPVIGVEFSPIAVRDFFEDAPIAFREETRGPLRRLSGGGYTLFCGDLFDLEPADLEGVRGCYDRASLIALPPELRQRYARKMMEILPREAMILLVTIEYDQTKMAGPPHSVPPSEVEILYGEEFEIERLETSGPKPASPRFQERGLDVWSEHVLLLRRRPGRAARE